MNVAAGADQEEHAPKKEVSQLPDAISALMGRSLAAFHRDLPELLKMKGRSRQWVAYHGDQRIGFGKNKTELYQGCLRRGLRRGEFVVRRIEPEVPREAEIFIEV